MRRLDAFTLPQKHPNTRPIRLSYSPIPSAPGRMVLILGTCRCMSSASFLRLCCRQPRVRLLTRSVCSEKEYSNRMSRSDESRSDHRHAVGPYHSQIRRDDLTALCLPLLNGQQTQFTTLFSLGVRKQTPRRAASSDHSHHRRSSQSRL